MVNIRLANVKDIKPLCEFIVKAQKRLKIGQDQEVIPDSFAAYLMECIFGSGIYVFVAEDEKGIQGILVLNEVVCPWNCNYVYGSDNLFLALKGGLKLIRTAKELARKKDWNKLYFTTSMSNERADQLFNRIANKIGGTYVMEI